MSAKRAVFMTEPPSEVTVTESDLPIAFNASSLWTGVAAGLDRGVTRRHLLRHPFVVGSRTAAVRRADEVEEAVARSRRRRSRRQRGRGQIVLEAGRLRERVPRA